MAQGYGANLIAISEAEMLEITNPPPTPEVLVAELERLRKAEEKKGVTLNGVRYSGSKENRQALSEAIQFATEFNLVEFTSWKDSDGGFHNNHPVADVQQALRDIAEKRMMLISRESELKSEIEQGTLVDLSNIDWYVGGTQ